MEIADDVLDLEKLRQEYEAVKALYERLAANLQQALTTFLEERNVSYLAVYHRIKSFDSLVEKIERKGYRHPLEECEDLCGVRIICYYPSDIEIIEGIVETELDIKESVDKGSILRVDEFGYRSTHFVVTIKRRWLAAPNYRGLQGLKAEIQVRTVLMHAWAEVEHKLAYKRPEDVPAQFRRKLSRLSAKFEEADEQFEELKNGMHAFRSELSASAIHAGTFDVLQSLNLDSLTAFLDFYFPDRNKSKPEVVRSFLRELDSAQITMAQLVKHVEELKPRASEYEDALKGMPPYVRWNQVGVARALLDIAHPGFRSLERLSGSPRKQAILDFRKKLGIAEDS